MAVDTPVSYRSQVMYSVYVRNHSPEGTFAAVQRDLERIRDLGTDVLWLLPIHPIGAEGHKGSLGCPYAIRDYRAVNPEYGTMEEFQALVDECHRLGMKCIIDVVYNHTSPDSWLARNHPAWFYHGPDGKPASRVADWSDVADLDYTHPALWDYQIETLKYWAATVDGFRCDVASMVPLAFWLRARAEVEPVRPGCLWLAESVHPQFIAAMRRSGVPCLSDGELYQAFDVLYQYDIFPVFEDYLAGRVPLARYVEVLAGQDILYPDNYVKLRYLENHDQPRAAWAIPDPVQRENWTAFLFFQRGMTLLYAGQEASASRTPSLFDRDEVDWSGEDIAPQLRRLAALKRDVLLTEAVPELAALDGDMVRCVYRGGGRTLVGLFSLRGSAGAAEVPLPDGVYAEKLRGGSVTVRSGQVRCSGRPLVLEAGAGEPCEIVQSEQI